MNWRKLNLEVGLSVYKNHLQHSEVKAYVVDDSVKQLCSQKMEGVSINEDHLTGRSCMGQQVRYEGISNRGCIFAD